MTIRECLQFYKTYCDAFDAELIVAAMLHTTREHIIAYPDETIEDAVMIAIDGAMTRRRNHEPLAYILGHKEFYGLNFLVTQDTLIPRPETELMVDEIRKLVSMHHTEKSHRTLIIDIGTGSGCIIISVAHEILNTFPTFACDFYGIDISQRALEVAQKNAHANNLDAQTSFQQSDLLESCIDTFPFAKYEHIIIAANLPYLSTSIYNNAPPDVKNFEPISALISDHEGLMHYEKLLKQLQNILSRTAASSDIFFEISPEQNSAIQKIIPHYLKTSHIHSLRDLTQRHRLIHIQTSAQ